MPKPKLNTERVSIFLDEETLKELKIEAIKKGVNLSTYIRMIVLERKK